MLENALLKPFFTLFFYVSFLPLSFYEKVQGNQKLNLKKKNRSINVKKGEKILRKCTQER